MQRLPNHRYPAMQVKVLSGPDANVGSGARISVPQATDLA